MTSLNSCSGKYTHAHHREDSWEWTSLLFLQRTGYYWPEHEELGQNETGWGREEGEKMGEGG